MPLPTSRNKTYFVGMPVDAQVLNDLQDSVVGNHQALTGIPVNVGAVHGSGDWRVFQATRLRADASDYEWYIPCRLPVGARITAMSARGRDTAPSDEKYWVRLFRDDGENSALFVFDLEPKFPTSWATVSKPLSTPHVVLPGNIYFVQLTTFTNDLAELLDVWLTLDFA